MKKKFEELEKAIKEKEIINFERLNERNKEIVDNLIKLCKVIEAPQLSGKNIAFFGLAGMGKSSLINALSGDPHLCKTGDCEVILEGPTIVPCKTSGIIFWDVPGITDQTNYFSSKYIPLIKGLSFVGIVVDRSITQVLNFAHVLKMIDVKFCIIRNKIDLIETPLSELKKTFEGVLKDKKELIGENIKVYYVSAKNPKGHDFPQLSLDAFQN